MNSGTGMIMGAGVGIIFSPALGPFGIVLGAGLGMVIAAAIAPAEPPTDDNPAPT